MTSLDSNIAIRNYAGVPVVELAGDINKKVLAALNDVLSRLASAGHFNVMINVQHAARHNLAGLTSLRKAARLFKAHYGNLDLIVDAEQIFGLGSLESLFRICTSEWQALTHIRRLPALSVGIVIPMSAHLAES